MIDTLFCIDYFDIPGRGRVYTTTMNYGNSKTLIGKLLHVNLKGKIVRTGECIGVERHGKIYRDSDTCPIGVLMRQPKENIMNDEVQVGKIIDKSFKKETDEVVHQGEKPLTEEPTTRRPLGMFERHAAKKKNEAIIEIIDDLKIEFIDDYPIKNYAEYKLEEQLKDVEEMITSSNDTIETFVRIRTQIEQNVQAVGGNLSILENRKRQLIRAIDLIK